MSQTQDTVRTNTMKRIVDVLGMISLENAADGFFYDVRPERVRRGRRIAPNDPPPCLSVFAGLELPDDEKGKAQSGGRMSCKLSVSVAFKASLEQDAEGTDIELAAERFAADIQLAMGKASLADTGAAAFYVPIPKYPTGVVDPQFTVWWYEVGVQAFVSQAFPNSIIGTVDYLLNYSRSIFTPYQA